MYRLRFLLPILALLAVPAFADEGAKSADKPDKSEKSDKADKESAVLNLLPPDSVTQHTMQAGGQRLAYTATAGTLPLRDDKGEKSALVFYVAYTLQGANAATRPVSFFFNGGPGAGSAFLHLGAAGPIALEFPPGNEADGSGAKLKENTDTWLPFTDMVFIDAVGTGFSRPAKVEDAPKEFWGVKQDAQAFAKVVALWLDKNGRSASPKYLVGESYGGIRSIKVARELQNEQSVILDGIVMISPAIEMDSIDGGESAPLSDALRIPSFVAASLERNHKFAVQSVEDAYHFAIGEYLTTVVGEPPQGDAAKSFYGKIAAMTEVPEDVVARQRGRLDPSSHEVRTINGRLFSLYEASLSIADPFPEGGEGIETDPVLFGYGRAYGNAMAGYAADALGFKTELTYKLLAMDVNEKWDLHSDGKGPVTGFDDLRRLLALDPALKVFVAGGYFDLVVPFESNRWLVDHLPVGRDRVTFKAYPGGHMLYTRLPSRAALKSDVSALYPGAAAK
ncbi:MAG TPA: peptidase S10 [Stellaceae bacterium]|nr:peptidase S10 [Stellaceae bacterium]